MTSSNGNIFRVTGPCEGNSPVTGGFPSQRASDGALMFTLMPWCPCDVTLMIFITYSMYFSGYWYHFYNWHTYTHTKQPHYIDVIMGTIASQITSLTIVYSTVYSGADQRKHQSSASLAFVRGIHRDRWIPRTKGQLRAKCFHLMTSSCKL